ncbi:MAG: hypothetical protein IT375_25850 [Polyangiaceae bacterium]|nr:hypothetical protein [Polyangiaceae bacterium]
MLNTKGPGLLGYLLPPRSDLGLHDPNTLRSNMVRLLADNQLILGSMPEDERPGPALDSIPPDERTALLLSLATTVCRAEYHERRFWKVTEHLAERRLLVGAPVLYDAAVSSAVFEGAGALGGARTVVDEVVHIAARRNGAKKWSASDAARGQATNMTGVEIDELQTRAAWFDALNKYRNVLFHRGWRGNAGGYFPPDCIEPEAQDPERNLLLMPDLDSVTGDARAHQWTYTEDRHLESVVREALDGMRDFVDTVCLRAWDGKLPKPGKIPPEEQPNILIGSPRPAPFLGADAIYLPVFSSVAKSNEFSGYPSRVGLHLASLPLLNAFFPEPAFAFCIAGFEPHVIMGRTLTVLVDPTSMGPIQARIVAPVAPSLMQNPPFMDPVGLPKKAIGAEQLLCWAQR